MVLSALVDFQQTLIIKTTSEVLYVQFDGDPNPKNVGSQATRVTNYVEQLRILASTDVLIAAHGAALSSMVVLPVGAVVIELFPHNFRYHMYAELASLLRLQYMPIESREPWGPSGPGCSGCSATIMPPVPRPYHTNGLKKCQKCTPQCKKCDIKVDEERWAAVVCFPTSE
ncbi:glycosyltransferase [Diplonema papillatum]|nr:glycosyltransferase [Diplonema papillatum]